MCIHYRLETKVDGSPQPKVRWLKQDAEINPSPEFQIENFDDGTSVLTITEVYPDDIGEIVCEAYNDLGVATTTTVLTVQGIRIRRHPTHRIKASSLEVLIDTGVCPAPIICC